MKTSAGILFTLLNDDMIQVATIKLWTFIENYSNAIF